MTDWARASIWAAVRTIQGLLTDPFPDAKILPLFLREPLLLSEALRTVPRLFTPEDFLGTTLTSASPAFAGVGRKAENPRRNESPSAKTKNLPARTAKNLLSPPSNFRHPFPKISIVRQGNPESEPFAQALRPARTKSPRVLQALSFILSHPSLNAEQKLIHFTFLSQRHGPAWEKPPRSRPAPGPNDLTEHPFLSTINWKTSGMPPIRSTSRQMEEGIQT